jgi:hypothetical protein
LFLGFLRAPDWIIHWIPVCPVAVITIDSRAMAASSTTGSTSRSTGNRSCLIRTRLAVRRRSVRRIPSAVTARRRGLHRPVSITWR